MTTLGARLREARLAAGLTQGDLAGEGISASFVSRIESDVRQPGTEVLRVFARRLGVSPDWLRRGTAGGRPPATALEIRDLAEADLAAGDPESARERLAGLDPALIPVRHRASTAVLLSHAQELCGDFEAARTGLEPLWAEAVADERAEDVLALTRGLLYLYIVSGRQDVALRVGTRALATIAGHEVDPDERLRVGATLMWAQIERGDLVHARQRGRELLAEATTAGSVAGRAAVLWNLSLTEKESGRFDRARRHAGSAVELMGDGPGARDRDFFRARLHYGSTALHGEDAAIEVALDQLSAARSGLAVLGGPVDLVTLDVEHSRAHLLLGDLAEAERWAESALGHGVQQAPAWQVEAMIALADVLMAGRRTAAARDLCQQASGVLEAAGDTRESAALWRALGGRLHLGGASEAASRAFDRALSAAGLRPRRSASRA